MLPPYPPVKIRRSVYLYWRVILAKGDQETLRIADLWNRAFGKPEVRPGLADICRVSTSIQPGY